MNGSVTKFWVMAMIAGIFTAVLGLSTLYVPSLVRGGFETMVGIVIILSGVAQAVYTFSCRCTIDLERSEGFVLSILLAILSLCVGIVILLVPLETFITFTTLVGVYFGLDGALRIGRGLSLRRQKWFLLPILLGLTSIGFFILVWYYLAGAMMTVIARWVGALFFVRGLAICGTAFVVRDYCLCQLPAAAQPQETPAGSSK